MVSMLQEVLRSGTGAGVRSLGFTLPAAGKTGTSRDGWFAGFTSELLCVVWVGFDDNRELNLEGARFRPSDLGRVHAARGEIQAVSRRQGVCGAARNRLAGDLRG